MYTLFKPLVLKWNRFFDFNFILLLKKASKNLLTIYLKLEGFYPSVSPQRSISAFIFFKFFHFNGNYLIFSNNLATNLLVSDVYSAS